MEGAPAVCHVRALPFDYRGSLILETLRSLLYNEAKGSGGSERLDNLLKISQLLRSRTKVLNGGLSVPHGLPNFQISTVP